MRHCNVCEKKVPSRYMKSHVAYHQMKVVGTAFGIDRKPTGLFYFKKKQRKGRS